MKTPFFEPLFLPGEREPWGIMYAIENQGMSKMERPMFAVWTEDRLDKKGMHFLIDADGKKKSVNPGDVNPYGIYQFVLRIDINQLVIFTLVGQKM